MTRYWRTTEEDSECLPYDLLCPGMGEGGTRGRVRLLSPANVTLLSKPETPEKNFHQWPMKTLPAINTCEVRWTQTTKAACNRMVEDSFAKNVFTQVKQLQAILDRSYWGNVNWTQVKQTVLGQHELNTGQNRLYWGNLGNIKPNTVTETRGCASGGVHLPCIYIHARWELPSATQVFVLMFVWCLWVLINSFVWETARHRRIQQ